MRRSFALFFHFLTALQQSHGVMVAGVPKATADSEVISEIGRAAGLDDFVDDAAGFEDGLQMAYRVGVL